MVNIPEDYWKKALSEDMPRKEKLERAKTFLITTLKPSDTLLYELSSKKVLIPEDIDEIVSINHV